MSTAACPGTVPTVLNGQVTTATAANSVLKEFECLAGFYMTGSKTISCSGAVTAVWTTAPTCNVISDNNEVFPEWWLIVAAIVLALAVLACFLCVLCYYCCGRGSNTSVHPYDRAEGGANCCRDGCGCSNGCCRGGCGGACCGASTGCCLMSGGGRCCPCCCRGDGGGATKGKGRGKLANSGQNGVYYVSTPPQPQYRGDSEQSDVPSKQKRAKEVRGWMPHSNPVRSFNTSTK